MDYFEQRRRLNGVTYTELRWLMRDYAPFDRALQYRVVRQDGKTKHIIVPWLDVQPETIP